MADVRPHPHDVMVHAVLSDVAEATGFLRVICQPPSCRAPHEGGYAKNPKRQNTALSLSEQMHGLRAFADSETALITMQRHLNRGCTLQLLSFVSGD